MFAFEPISDQFYYPVISRGYYTRARVPGHKRDNKVPTTIASRVNLFAHIYGGAKHRCGWKNDACRWCASGLTARVLWPRQRDVRQFVAIKGNPARVDILDEITTKIARQARSPAIYNIVQTAARVSGNNSENTNTVEINVSSWTCRGRNRFNSLLYAILFRRVFPCNSTQLANIRARNANPIRWGSFARTYRHVKALGSRRCAHCVRAVNLGGHVSAARAFIEMHPQPAERFVPRRPGEPSFYGHR